MKTKKLSLMVAVVSLALVMLVPSVFANGCNGVTIIKELACGSAPTSGLDLFTPYLWRVRIRVTNNNPYTITDVYVQDRFGAEFAVSVYSGPTVGAVSLTTKGASAKVFLDWDIGSLAPGASAEVVLNVETDINPGGKQEFTSCGEYYLNSGAVVKWLDDMGVQHSAETGTIVVTTY